MKNIKYLIIIILLFTNLLTIEARELGETEITTEEGIEVYQKEKYYLLKKNVQILSDTFTLNAQLVKAFFEKDLYDISDIHSQGNVVLTSSDGLNVKGENVQYNAKNENIFIKGENSFLQNNTITMISDGYIKLNNLTGNFELNGKNSKLTTPEILILGESIKGKYFNLEENNKIDELYVEDSNELFIETEKMEMYALKANYSSNTNIIELFDNVKIIRNDEIITGDYGKINTLDESYKIVSDETKRVKVLLKKTNE